MTYLNYYFVTLPSLSHRPSKPSDDTEGKRVSFLGGNTMLTPALDGHIVTGPTVAMETTEKILQRGVYMRFGGVFDKNNHPIDLNDHMNLIPDVSIVHRPQLSAFQAACKAYSDVLRQGFQAGLNVVIDELGPISFYLRPEHASRGRRPSLDLSMLKWSIQEPYLDILNIYNISPEDVRIITKGHIRMTMLQFLDNYDSRFPLRKEITGACGQDASTCTLHDSSQPQTPRINCTGIGIGLFLSLSKMDDGAIADEIHTFWGTDSAFPDRTDIDTVLSGLTTWQDMLSDPSSYLSTVEKGRVVPLEIYEHMFMAVFESTDPNTTLSERWTHTRDALRNISLTLNGTGKFQEFLLRLIIRSIIKSQIEKDTHSPKITATWIGETDSFNI